MTRVICIEEKLCQSITLVPVFVFIKDDELESKNLFCINGRLEPIEERGLTNNKSMIKIYIM